MNKRQFLSAQAIVDDPIGDRSHPSAVDARGQRVQ